MRNALQHIRAFVAVAHAGNFAKAATQLHRSPSALTVQVQQLETWLGITLLDRGPRHLALTPAGRQNLAPMEKLLMDLDNIVEQSHDLAGLRRGVVELAALPSLCSGVLPRVMGEFQQQYPGVEIRLRDVVAHRIDDLVRNGDVEFGLGGRGKGGGLDFRFLLMDRLCVCVRDDHPLAHRQPLTLADLSGQPMILTGRDSSVREQVERVFADHGLRLIARAEANYMSTVVALVQQGQGISLLPESAALGQVGVSCRVIDGPHMNREIGLITRAEQGLSPAASAFVKHFEGRVQ
jgi:DNA-binding transcriptional LysR family regulator